MYSRLPTLRIANSPNASAFSAFLIGLSEQSPYLPLATQFVLSSSFALTFTDTLLFVEDDHVLIQLQTCLPSRTSWAEDAPAVQKRGKQILAKLDEEGLSDAFERHIRFTSPVYSFPGDAITFDT
ncbi:hypothetical protein BLNAU_18880 [Blattamonas nauphoetae]|uniref:Uncharacterized protein n=1 Tax=Blattamonas nauphoetae TaxID=2049346 RepID=A0ABQ9X369_9EUKA|nr:hypothetical protein BLNAU_18880 [Blattamonas nauphoetae]